MADALVVSPNRSLGKTRNAILRMKNCSPELRSVLRQRCQERINNERSKILSSMRKIEMNDSFRMAFGSIIREEWINIESEELCKPISENSPAYKGPENINLDEELLLEEILEKELLQEHENWLLQQYEELLSEQVEDSNSVTCPMCCLGFLRLKDFSIPNQVKCSKCSETFTIDKNLLDFQASIYKYLEWHDQQCVFTPSFTNVLKSENESNLCIVCDHCSFLNIII